MTQGKLDPKSIPNDGLIIRQRRMILITAVHTDPGKGESIAAFDMAMRAWNQGVNAGVSQFMRLARWKVDEGTITRWLDELYDGTGEDSPAEWHKMGEGWSWSRKQDTEEGHAAAAAEGWQEIKRRLENEVHSFYVLGEFTYPIKWGWTDVDDVVEALENHPSRRHVVMTGRDADPKLVEVADLVTEMTEIKHSMDVGCKGQKGIEW